MASYGVASNRVISIEFSADCENPSQKFLVFLFPLSTNLSLY